MDGLGFGSTAAKPALVQIGKVSQAP